ncbi:MAG: sodium:proton antiporter [Alistipes sp.]|nr:sodium:proton antiporter [Alistipes sp.]
MHEVQIWALIPFCLMLLGIAVFPFIIGHWWEHNRNKFIVSLVLGTPVAIYLCCNGMSHEFVHQMLFDYVPFIMLLASLFVVTGGLHQTGDVAAKPWVNTLILAAGWLAASFIGTTGAAMLLIRSLLEINKQRKYKVHTILFFIAIVANCGGVLSPLGDPPLFLLYLRGVEFTWFMHLLPEWLFAGAMLLIIYFATDSWLYRKEPQENIHADNTEITPIRIKGTINLIYLVGIILAVAFINPGEIPAMGEHNAPIYMKYLREIVLAAIMLLSWFTTKKQVRKENGYTWTPIVEVAVLFIGIFATMTPALLYLEKHAAALGFHQAWQFFYGTGALSSVLDNAPTAVAFYSMASGLPVDGATALVAGVPETLLRAIALGAVFFGAMTYIGNGPNFMIKSIAEEHGINMPSFFGYIFKFSIVVLLPIYILTQLIFL